MSRLNPRDSGPGPFHADQLRSGDRYELSQGHAIYCSPTGGDGARGALTGGGVLHSDPAVEEAGLDAGYAPDAGTLRAPDIAVGNVPDRPGWISGVPALAVEYASVGQDEAELQAKITELLTRGTQLVWVVRLLGPRFVEIYAPEQEMRRAAPGEELTADGILHNPVPVEALFDRRVADDATLRNLLQRRGYEALDAVRDEGRQEGRQSGITAGKRHAVEQFLNARFGALSDHAISALHAADDARLDEITRRVAVASALEDIFPVDP